MNETPNYTSLETCTHNRLITINDQIRSTRNKASITGLVETRKQTDKLLSKIRVARQRHPNDFGVYNALLTEYKNQVLT